MDNKKATRNSRKKQIILFICLVLISVFAIGSTMALLNSATVPVTNEFERADITCEVTETFDGTTKSNVSIKNTAEDDKVSGYIRAVVLVSWQDGNGNVYGKQPVQGTDYNITYGTGWDVIDGYYYWPNVVAPGESTGILIKECTEVKGKAPNGYALTVDIIAEIIQSNPEDAVKDAWKYEPSKTGGQ